MCKSSVSTRILALLAVLQGISSLLVAPAAAQPRAGAGSTPGDTVLFPRPAAIEPRVRLWTRVYSEVETNGGLIHDNEELDIVYDVVRWPKHLSERASTQRYERAKEQVRHILRRLATGPRANLTAEEQRVLALFPKGVSAQALRAAAERVRFQRGQADKFRDGVIRSGRWETHIAGVFRERGLPGDLAALPHVESSYNPVAHSHAGAGGLWQFMPATARRFKLRVDRTLDERYDPWRSSEAAAAFLAENHRMLQSWPLALTAYNHGPGGMARAARELGTRDIGVIIDRYQSRTFGFASRNFYAEFLAARDVDRYAPRYFGKLERERPADDEVIVTQEYYSVRALARAFGVDIGLLRELNLGLRDPVWRGQQLIPRGYAVRLPRVAGRQPAPALLASIPAEERRVEQPRGKHHVVQRGDTLSAIARRFGVSPSALAKANGIRKPSSLPVGRRLRIPGSVEVAVSADEAARKPPQPAKAAAVTAAKPPAVAPKTHRVRRGETLSAIARRHGVSVQELAAANRIQRKDLIRPGQLLRLPREDG